MLLSSRERETTCALPQDVSRAFCSQLVPLHRMTVKLLGLREHLPKAAAGMWRAQGAERTRLEAPRTLAEARSQAATVVAGAGWPTRLEAADPAEASSSVMVDWASPRSATLPSGPGFPGARQLSRH